MILSQCVSLIMALQCLHSLSIYRSNDHQRLSPNSISDVCIVSAFSVASQRSSKAPTTVGKLQTVRYAKANGGYSSLVEFPYDP
jgi:hypothetical protein